MIGEVKSAFTLILCIVFLTMSTIYINIYLTDYLSVDNLLKFNVVSQTFYFVIMLFIIFLTILNIKNKHHYEKLEFENSQFTDYMNSLELINHDMQKFQHDYTNILFTMQGYLETENYEELKGYFKKNIFSIEEDIFRKNSILSNLTNLQITGLKGLILVKTLQAEKEAILINVEIPEVINDLNINVIDIARIIGIFLDNSIEANIQSNNDKEINIAIFNNSENYTMIIIENTIGYDFITIDKIRDGFSTKGENRGKGLSIVKEIINNYPNIMLYTNINGNLFTQIIEIKNEENK